MIYDMNVYVKRERQNAMETVLTLKKLTKGIPTVIPT
jgi:hypothetical protein